MAHSRDCLKLDPYNQHKRLAEDPRMVITTYEGRHVHSPSRDDDDAARASAEMTFIWPSPSTHASHLPPRGQLVASVDACGPSDADRIFPLRSTARETRSRENINSSDLMDLSAIAIAHCISTKQPNHKVGASRERKKER
uniref:WRKY domain-containing protein n=1 Tax=Oryza glumipatula TaxID=40148 RepID=A0A0D9Y477_9ORYZ